MFKTYFSRFIIFSSIIFPLHTSSQVIKEILSNQGGSNMIGKSYISYTIGQPLVTGLFTLSNKVIIQGFEYKSKSPNLINHKTTNNTSLPLNVSVFPNPFKESIFVQGNKNIFPLNIHVFDITGKLIFTKKKQNYLEKEIFLNNLKNGYYIVLIESKTKTFRTILLKND